MGEAPEKWICTDCRIVVEKPLSAPNPFDPADTIFGCPSCKSVGTLVQACQHEGCQQEAGGGYPGGLGYWYAWLCWEHRPREARDD